MLQGRGLTRLVHKHAQFLEMLSGFDAAVPAGSLNLHIDGNGFAELELDNVDKRGSMSATMMLQLAAHVDELTLDEGNITGLALRSRGKIFCSGLDLNLAKGLISTPERGGMMYDFMTDALNRIKQSPMVSVTVLQGSAIGGGLELATSTDYRVVVQKQSEVKEGKGPYIQSVHAKIGAAPGWGGLQRSVDIMGGKNTLSLYGTSARVSPEEALDLGLVDHIVSLSDEELQSGDFDALTSGIGRRFLDPFLQQPYPLSVGAIKTAIAAHDEEVEGAVFRDRWFGEDMKGALGK